LGRTDLTIIDARVTRLSAELHAEHGKRSLERGDVESATAHLRRAADAGIGWKVRLMSRALRIAPHLSLRAYQFRTRRHLVTSSRHA
jgi:hypothetical protein